MINAIVIADQTKLNTKNSLFLLYMEMGRGQKLVRLDFGEILAKMALFIIGARSNGAELLCINLHTQKLTNIQNSTFNAHIHTHTHSFSNANS